MTTVIPIGKRAAYPAYKPSGVTWVGDIPEHWECGNIRRYATMKTGHTPSRDHPEYWTDCTIPWFGLADVWQLRDGRRKYLEETKEKISELGLRNSAAELLPAGTVVFSRTASIGFSGIMPVPMATTQDFWNWICGQRLMPDYLLYIFRAMHEEFQGLTMGSTHKTIYQPVAAAISIPIAPLDEQRAIAAFLDRETARIDGLIVKKQRQIELLQEKRAALISHAVTKGLDRNVKMKDSGIEWLGQIPDRWEILKLRRITTSRCDGPFGSGLKSMHYRDDGVRVVRLQNIRFAAFDGTDEAFIDPEYYRELGDHDVRPGDLLIAGLGDDRNPVGRACVAPPAIGPAMVKADCFCFRIDQQLAVPEYLAYHLSATAAALNGALATGTTRSRMNLSETADRSVLLPPHEEQQAIADFLNCATARIDPMVTRIDDSIELLRKYRTALISAAVTGRIDVRNGAIS